MNYELRITDWKTITALAAIVIIIWTALIFFGSPLDTPREIIVKEGQGVSAIADMLEKEGVISNKFIFIAYALVTGNEKELQAGKYVFQPGITMPTVVYSMAQGLAESDDAVLTIPEGSNVWDIDRQLTNGGFIKAGNFAKQMYQKEGYIFPDTYRFPNPARTATTLENMAAKMTENFRNKTEAWLAGLSDSDKKRVLVIASILEKEAKTDEDMRLIAGIIEKRLELKMLLQIDATVAYGACARNIDMSKYRNVEYCDVSQIGVANEIKIDGRYNTYTRAGLPPGPISNPGITAIKAAINPVASGYLYYLSTRPGRSGDGSQIIFSKTASEHSANRRKYLGI